ncbi:phosphoadenosine phosphosulfate reductase family protein [Paenibacillus sp. GP183]|uniref:phosphoadenosine phosphosulfate reductase domain-containing protein n=1 Tax=Paenibacillus sp. GP183 TaxID=1882751 RepID=UPI0011153EC3|nr:phosphoadenosine phosphosulfate reductase family protein [Paenibacillus sp. GP183]
MLQKCKEELEGLGLRMKFPAKGADLSTRYCSAYLKIMVGATAIAHSSETKANCKILMVSGERRGESLNRSRYNECEIHGMNAEIRNRRTVHVFRPIIDWSLSDVWEKIRRFRIQPCPTYEIFNRCSCAICVFNSPSHWASVKLIYPNLFQQVVDAEKELGFTLGDMLPCLKAGASQIIGDRNLSPPWRLYPSLVFFRLRYVFQS